MKREFKQSPNISSKPITPKGIVLHHTAGSYSGSVSWCLNSQSQVSYHCIVDLNGDMTTLAKDTQRAWHSGKSLFRGVADCNSYMLGIAVTGDTNIRNLSNTEIEVVALWCIEKMKLWNFTVNDITTHRNIAPGRKNDVSIKAANDIICRIKELI